MAKPVILTVDDDPDVLQAIERDLRSRYSERYRILRAASANEALDTLHRLKSRNDAVALLLADQRMPELDGVGFLSQATELFPNAKRALLTAYADTNAAIEAINSARVHYFLLKPWDPPDQNLYPPLDDMLNEFMDSYHPPYEGIQLFGTRWSPKAYELRMFLAQNHLPYQWVDVEQSSTTDSSAALHKSDGTAETLPLMIFPDGTKFSEPTSADIAKKIGLRTHTDVEFYDLAIVGGGPAGLAAAVYGASEGLRTVMIEREAPGGQAGLSSRIENYLGFPAGLSGRDLARRAVVQATRFGVEILSPQEAGSVRIEGPYRIIEMTDGSKVSCHALLLAMGVQWRSLGVPGEERLRGAGVYYGGGVTEAMSCKGETVYVVGGANSAGQAAMNFAGYAEKVVMIIRRESLAATMSQYLIDQIKKTPNIQVWPQAQIAEVHGDQHLEEISVYCSPTKNTERVPAKSLFIYIGALPRTDWLGDLVQRDARGFILSGPDLLRDGKRPQGWSIERDPSLLESSVPGIFVVGDVRHGSVKRVASGVGEGAVAIQFVHQYLAKVS
ncbi:MAG TPA: FAD-dependent oxidoreductase [Candidatus Sulfotelmatobacter sp.]|jgi:thioredoxin reductase (NADPH)|nr:FAD-dependent oxidoreductase [Candidatus Sulfotelmatobacter sp.]